VNLLDYTSVVVPVTNVDKSVDKRDEGFKAVGEVDQQTQDTCKPFPGTYRWMAWTMKLTM
jgi:amidase